jgi:argininosuccinate lyase
LPEVLAFSTSLGLDRQLLKEDLLGSMAHVTMLGRTGVIPAKEARVIRDGLVDLWLRDDAGTLVLPDEEDVHMAVEVELNRTMGSPAALLHSARSRNDQVATDMRLWFKHATAVLGEKILGAQRALLAVAGANRDVLIPGYTHLQRAQPICLAHHLLAYVEMAERDRQRLADGRRRLNVCPLGAAALAGTPVPIDRRATAAELGMKDQAFMIQASTFCARTSSGTAPCESTTSWKPL